MDYHLFFGIVTVCLYDRQCDIFSTLYNKQLKKASASTCQKLHIQVFMLHSLLVIYGGFK